MPRVRADGVELFYESLGEGTPLIFQAHDHTPWLFFQAPVFSQTYRVVTFDRRGLKDALDIDHGWLPRISLTVPSGRSSSPGSCMLRR